MLAQHLIVLLFVLLAAGYLAWVLTGGFRRGGGACGCGPKKGCARMEEALRASERKRR